MITILQRTLINAILRAHEKAELSPEMQEALVVEPNETPWHVGTRLVLARSDITAENVHAVKTRTSGFLYGAHPPPLGTAKERRRCAYADGGLICTKAARKKSDFCHAHRTSGKLRVSNHVCPECRGEKRVLADEHWLYRDCTTCGGIGRTLVVNQRKHRALSPGGRS